MFQDIREIYLKQISTLNEKVEIEPGKKDVSGDQEIDQNKDGLNNFMDVMIARMMASGMSKKEATDYVAGKYTVKPKVQANESFSNWRQDLCEVVSDEETQIGKKKVNNYATKAVNLKPTLSSVAESFGGELIDEFILDEEYINDVIEIAAEYFCEQGLNEEGIEIVAEEVGIDNFVEFAFDLAEDYIIAEARTLTGKKKTPATGKERGISQKAAPGKLTKAAVAQGKAIRSLDTRMPGVMRKKINTDKVKTAVDVAKEAQPQAAPQKAGALNAVANFIQQRVEADRKARERVGSALKTARDLAGQTASTVKKAASGATTALNTASDSKLAQLGRIGVKKAARRAGEDISKVGGAMGKGAGTTAAARRRGDTTTSAVAQGIRAGIGKLFGEDFRFWVDDVLGEGTDLGGYTVEELHEAYLEEKAVSEQQQKLFGLALAYKRGEVPKSKVSKQVIELADSMSEKELIKYASTKHEGIPKRV
jgi:DNA uptake protein ComE-like DNA-binding protein